jgi:O-antigen/teichoic acid export membrane protein
MNDFLTGIAACGCCGAAAFFLRYWRETKDRFFLAFAAAFLVLALNWALVAIWQPSGETRPFFYLLRLGAFGLIILAILDKNRAAPRRPRN